MPSTTTDLYNSTTSSPALAELHWHLLSPARLENENIPHNQADNSITKNTFHALKCLKPPKIPQTPNQYILKVCISTSVSWRKWRKQRKHGGNNAVVLHSFLQVTGGSRGHSGWNSKSLAFRTSAGTLFPSESRATLIRNRNPIKYLIPNLFPVYLGYCKFL